MQKILVRQAKPTILSIIFTFYYKIIFHKMWKITKINVDNMWK